MLAAASCAPSPTVAAGQQLFAENGCASCHGATGHGDGPVADTLAPRPRDFSTAIFTHGNSVDAIARTIAAGIQMPMTSHVGVTGAPIQHQQGMPKFAHLTDLERQSLALYVLSLRTPSR
jgi:mono/diheme cytochrome c family protein